MTKLEIIKRLRMLEDKLATTPNSGALPELVRAYEKVERWIRLIDDYDPNDNYDWTWMMFAANEWWDKEDWK